MRKYTLAATGLAAAALLGGSGALASTLAEAATTYTVSAVQYGSTTPLTSLSTFHTGNSAASFSGGTAFLQPGTTGFAGINLSKITLAPTTPEPVFKTDPAASTTPTPGPTLFIRVSNACTIVGTQADPAGDPLTWTVRAGGNSFPQTSWANAEAYAAGTAPKSVCTPAPPNSDPLSTDGFILVNGAVVPTPTSTSTSSSATPTPTGSSSSSPAVVPSAPTGVVPSGAVPTGGGIPAPSPWLPVGYALIALGLALSGTAFVLNKKQV
jgi:hypothetical protein